MSRQIDAIAIDNPQQLALEAENRFGSYKTWASGVSRSLFEMSVFTVPEQIEKLEFGKWLSDQQPENQAVLEAVSKLKRELEQVLGAVTNIADFIEIEEFELGKDVYTAEVLPSIEYIQFYVDELMAPIGEALGLYARLFSYENEKITSSLAKTEEILYQIEERTKNSVIQNLEEGHKTGQKVMITLLTVVISGAVLSLVIGFLLSRNISRPMQESIAGLTENSQQVAESSGQVSSASLILSDGASEQAAAQEEAAASLEEVASRIKGVTNGRPNNDGTT